MFKNVKTWLEYISNQVGEQVVVSAIWDPKEGFIIHFSFKYLGKNIRPYHLKFSLDHDYTENSGEVQKQLVLAVRAYLENPEQVTTQENLENLVKLAQMTVGANIEKTTIN